jgi:hypothetical protein
MTIHNNNELDWARLLKEQEEETKRYKALYETREKQLECAHKRIRDIKRCQRYSIDKNGNPVEWRFGKWIIHEEMVKAAALPHEDDER